MIPARFVWKIIQILYTILKSVECLLAWVSSDKIWNEFFFLIYIIGESKKQLKSSLSSKPKWCIGFLYIGEGLHLRLWRRAADIPGSIHIFKETPSWKEEVYLPLSNLPALVSNTILEKDKHSFSSITF